MVLRRNNKIHLSWCGLWKKDTKKGIERASGWPLEWWFPKKDSINKRKTQKGKTKSGNRFIDEVFVGICSLERENQSRTLWGCGPSLYVSCDEMKTTRKNHHWVYQRNNQIRILPSHFRENELPTDRNSNAHPATSMNVNERIVNVPTKNPGINIL